MRKIIGYRMIDGVKCKRCSRCKKWQPLNCFNKNKSRRDKLDHWCKKCNKQYRIDRIEEIKKQRKQYNIDNPERRAWYDMINRCTNPKNISYKNYGERGITVCDQWRNSYDAFLEDVGPRPGPEYSIDRINNNGNYEPGNCKWSTRKEQNNNKRPTSYGPYKQFWFYGHGPNGEMIIENNISHVAKVFGLNQSHISGCLTEKRKQHKGWTFQKIDK